MKEHIGIVQGTAEAHSQAFLRGRAREDIAFLLEDDRAGRG